MSATGPGWTPETLKVSSDEKLDALAELFASELRRVEAMIGANQRIIEALKAANDVSMEKFERSVERRFMLVNEFRGALSDLGHQMATRRELEAFQSEYRRAHDELVAAQADLRTQVAVGPPALSSLQSRQDRQLGRDEGIRVTITMLYSLIAAVAAISGVIGHFI